MDSYKILKYAVIADYKINHMIKSMEKLGFIYMGKGDLSDISGKVFDIIIDIYKDKAEYDETDKWEDDRLGDQVNEILDADIEPGEMFYRLWNGLTIDDDISDYDIKKSFIICSSCGAVLAGKAETCPNCKEKLI